MIDPLMMPEEETDIRLLSYKDTSEPVFLQTGQETFWRFSRVQGISIDSVGWIFSRWANKTMQEDLSVAT